MASAPLRISTTTRMPSLSDSSLTSDTPSMVLELTRSAICSQSEALLVWYGMEVITTASRAWPFLPPPLTFSTVAAPLRFTPPCPCGTSP